MIHLIATDEATVDQIRNWLVRTVGPIDRACDMMGSGWQLRLSRRGIVIVKITDERYVTQFESWLGTL